MKGTVRYESIHVQCAMFSIARRYDFTRCMPHLRSKQSTILRECVQYHELLLSKVNLLPFFVLEN